MASHGKSWHMVSHDHPISFPIGFLTGASTMYNPMKSPLPSGKHTNNYGKSPFSMGKSTISMASFNSYVWHNQRVNPHQIPTEIPWNFPPNLPVTPRHHRSQETFAAPWCGGLRSEKSHGNGLKKWKLDSFPGLSELSWFISGWRMVYGRYKPLISTIMLVVIMVVKMVNGGYNG